jgi:hypothetical protein
VLHEAFSTHAFARQAPVDTITIELLFWFIGDTTTTAGTGAAGFADGDSATAQFKAPTGVAVAPNGAVIVVDYVIISCTPSFLAFLAH